MIKTHILRVHKEVASCINAELHTACAKFKYLLKRDQPCRWCDRTVHGADRHCSQCPVLFQLVLEQIRREADSASPQIDLPTEWPMPQPALQKSIAECLAEPTAEHDYALLKNMPKVAKTHCLLCGEQVQDIQDWRRHTKAKHEAQRSLVDALGRSSTLLAARLIRPCPWCDVTFKNQLKNIGRSAYRYSSLACDMTQSPAPLEPEQQLAAVWGLSSPLAGTPTPARQGNAARVRTNPGQPNKFRKGLGKGTNKSPQAKRSREQEAEEEFWMDQDQLDEETIKRILRLLVRAASRHEQQLTSLEADRSYVFFLEVVTMV